MSGVECVLDRPLLCLARSPASVGSRWCGSSLGHSGIREPRPISNTTGRTRSGTYMVAGAHGENGVDARQRVGVELHIVDGGYTHGGCSAGSTKGAGLAGQTRVELGFGLCLEAVSCSLLEPCRAADAHRV
jgi:hypothetical protein